VLSGYCLGVVRVLSGFLSIRPNKITSIINKNVCKIIKLNIHYEVNFLNLEINF